MKIEGIENTAVHLQPQDAIMAGMDLLSRTVQVTLGPAGQLVALQMRIGQPTYTKDGVTVARHVWSKDPVENAAIQSIVGSAGEMNVLVGDGTTTTVILATELAKHLLKLKGKDYQETLRHLRRFFTVASNAVKATSREIENDKDTLLAIADIACNGDAKISEVVASAVHAVGKDGVVTYQDSPNGEPSYEVGHGIVIDRGYASAHFVGKDGKIVFGGETGQACLVFISSDTLTEAEELYPAMQAAASVGQPLLVIAPDIVGNALGIMVVNTKKGALKCCAVRAPGSGERRIGMLNDIAIATGGKVYTADSGVSLKDSSPDTLLNDFIGKAEQAIISDRRTVIVGPGGDAQEVADHVERLRAEVAANPLEQQKYQERIALLSGGIGTVYVPGFNASERIAGRYFVEDGISACFAALRGGVVTGGGLPFRTMLRAVQEAPAVGENANRAKEIFLSTVKRPIELLISNAVEGGTPGQQTYALMTEFLEMKDPKGIDIRTLETADLRKRRIWEPLLVSLTALKLAFGVAVTLGNTKAVIVQKEAEKR